MDNKKMNKIIIVAIVVLVVGLIGFGVYSLLNKNNDSNKDNPPVDNKTVEKTINGVYQKDNITIKVYQKNEKGYSGEKIVNIDISNGEDSLVSIDSELSGNVIENDFFDKKYTFTFKENDMDFTTNSEELTSGTYSKISDYTLKDYYKDHYGDEAYINSKYNGEYKLNDIKAYLYQKDEKTVRVSIKGSIGDTSYLVDVDCDIMDNDVLKGSVFDSTYEIEFNSDNGFVFKTNDAEKKVLDGTYSKTKTLSMVEIVDLFFS